MSSCRVVLVFHIDLVIAGGGTVDLGMPSQAASKLVWRAGRGGIGLSQLSALLRIGSGGVSSSDRLSLPNTRCRCRLTPPYVGRLSVSWGDDTGLVGEDDGLDTVS